MKISRFCGRGRKTAILKCHKKRYSQSTANLKCTKKNPFFDCVAKIHKNPVLLTIRHWRWWWRWSFRIREELFRCIQVNFQLFIKKNRVENWNHEIKMPRNTLFLLDRENAFFSKKTTKLKWARKCHVAKFSCNNTLLTHVLFQYCKKSYSSQMKILVIIS